jgi:hypothetical protein
MPPSAALYPTVRLGPPKSTGGVKYGQTPSRSCAGAAFTSIYVLLNCCRQAGKSTVTAVLALHEALFVPNSLIVISSPGQRQSAELFRKILDNYNAVGRPVKARVQTQLKLELDNNNRILCLPGKEETVRCFSPSLLIIDEVSRVPDDLYRSVRPMLAVSQGRSPTQEPPSLVCRSIPFHALPAFELERVKFLTRCSPPSADFGLPVDAMTQPHETQRLPPPPPALFSVGPPMRR